MAVGLNLEDDQIAVSPSDGNGCTSAFGTGYRPRLIDVTVQVTYTYTPVSLLILSALGGNSVTMTAESTMTVE